MAELIVTEEQKQAFLNDIQEVEKKHKLQLCAILHRVETQLKSSHEAVLAIRETPKENEQPT
jgi:hypothetical protein